MKFVNYKLCLKFFLIVSLFSVSINSKSFADPNVVQIENSVPGWVKTATKIGATPLSVEQNGSIMVGNNETEMASTAQSISTPGTTQYQKFLTPDQFFQKFGTTQTQYNQVEDWLKNQGLIITSKDENFIAFKGTTDQINKAFQITLSNYKYLSPADRIYKPEEKINSAAPNKPYSIPRFLASNIFAIIGLENTGIKEKPEPEEPEPKLIKHECSKFWKEKNNSNLPKIFGQTPTYPICGYTSEQLRSAYSVPAQFTGKNVTVAFAGAENQNNFATDVNNSLIDTGQKPVLADKLKIITSPGFNRKTSIEAILDAVAIHEMAPDANIIAVGGTSNSPEQNYLLNSFVKVINNKLADVISCSEIIGYTNQLSPQISKAFDLVLMQAAIEGITVTKASGDAGPVGSNPTVPTANPWITSVGGTTLAIGSNNDYLWEQPWLLTHDILIAKNNLLNQIPGKPNAGGGFGTAATYPEPWYQKNVIPNSLNPNSNRIFPDISMEADPNTGIFVSSKNNTYNIAVGGTSLAAPLLAGYIASVIDARNGVDLGFINPKLYSLAGTNSYHRVDCVPAGSDKTPVFSKVGAIDFSGQCSVFGITNFGDSKYQTATGLGSPAAGLFDELTNNY